MIVKTMKINYVAPPSHLEYTTGIQDKVVLERYAHSLGWGLTYYKGGWALTSGFIFKVCCLYYEIHKDKIAAKGYGYPETALKFVEFLEKHYNLSAEVTLYDKVRSANLEDIQFTYGRVD